MFSKQIVEQGASLCGVQMREELWLAGCTNDTLTAHHYSASPRGGTVAGLQAQLSATVAGAAGVEVKDGCQVSTTLGQHSIWRRAAALYIAAGSKAPADNICHRGCAICPGPGVGDHLSPLRPDAGAPRPGPEQLCTGRRKEHSQDAAGAAAVLVDLSHV